MISSLVENPGDTLDRKQLEQEYSNRRPLYERIADEAAHTLEMGLRQCQIKFHSVTKRVKELSSFASKVERRQSEKPFEDITDPVGLRIVCLLRSDIPRIADLIRQSILDRTSKAFAQHEAKYPPDGGGLYWDIGAVRASLTIGDPKFRTLRYANSPCKNNSKAFEEFEHLLEPPGGK